MMSAMLQLVLLACVTPFLSANHENMNHLMITPQSPVLEIGTNFTATCMIINTAEVTADDLYWTVSKTTIPSEKYTKINETALSVTIPVTDEKPEWLYCRSRITSAYTQLNPGKFLHAIISEKGYPPEKPENLSCIAVQDKKVISRNISCSWEPGRDSRLTTTYTLHVKVIIPQTFNTSTYKNSAQVTLEIFPDHIPLEIWVEAKNGLGKVESEHLREDAGWFVKTNPPSDVKVISEKSFPTSLLINWTQPIAKEHMKLTYEIRFCPNGSQSWTYVPLVDIAKDIQSFRLKKLRPDTVYVTQVRCKNAREGHGYWSDWSTNATKRTPEDQNEEDEEAHESRETPIPGFTSPAVGMIVLIIITGVVFIIITGLILKCIHRRNNNRNSSKTDTSGLPACETPRPLEHNDPDELYTSFQQPTNDVYQTVSSVHHQHDAEIYENTQK